MTKIEDPINNEMEDVVGKEATPSPEHRVESSGGCWETTEDTKVEGGSKKNSYGSYILGEKTLEQDHYGSDMATCTQQGVARLPKRILGKNGGLEELLATDHKPKTEEEEDEEAKLWEEEFVLEDSKEDKDREIMHVVEAKECGSYGRPPKKKVDHQLHVGRR